MHLPQDINLICVVQLGTDSFHLTAKKSRDLYENGAFMSLPRIVEDMIDLALHGMGGQLQNFHRRSLLMP